MTLRVSALIEANGSQAKSEVESTKKAVTGLKTETDKVNAAGTRWSRGLSATGSRLANARTRMAAYFNSLKQVDDSQKLAAGSTANLTAQFNDIGVMLAAGQSPMQLAIQQGTQITQVLGNRGAVASVQALGGAFAGLLSPVNLVTIGSIAAGAAMFQWLTGSKEEADELKDTLDDLASATKEYRSVIEKTRSDLVGVYGTASAEVMALHRETQALLREDVERLAARAGNTVVALVQETKKNLSAATAELFGPDQNDALQDTAFVKKLADQFEALGKAEGIEQQLDLIQDLKAGILVAAGGFRDMNTEQLAVYQELRDAEDQLRQAIAARLAEQAQANRAMIQANEAYGRSRAESDRELAEGRDLLAQLQEEVMLRAAIEQYGENSAEVVDLRYQAEKRAFEAQVDAMEVSQDLKDELVAAWEAANQLSEKDIASGISAAGAEARNLADALGISVSLASRLAALGPQGVTQPGEKQYSGRGGDPRTQGGSALDIQTAEAGEFLANYKPPKDNRARAASAAQRQADALQNLLDREQRELDILREKDPIQQEMLRHRDLLKIATDEQREKLEELIGKQIEERAAIEGAAEAQDALTQNLFAGFQSLRQGADGAISAVESLADALYEAVLQATLLGEGPLAGLLGSGEGGFLGTIVSALIPGKAEGGMITGPGSGTSDDILMYGSSGEFMMNAKATAKHRHLLEALNAGMSLPGFAMGGGIGGPPPMAAFGALGGNSGPSIEIKNYGSTPVQGEIEETTDVNGRRKYRLVMSDQIGQGLSEPGGGAQRVLRNKYGVRKRGTVR